MASTPMPVTPPLSQGLPTAPAPAQPPAPQTSAQAPQNIQTPAPADQPDPADLLAPASAPPQHQSWFHRVMSWFEKEFTKFGHAEQAALSALKITAPLLEGILSAIPGGAAAVPVINTVISDWGTANTVLQASQAGGTGAVTLDNALEAVQANLPAILQEIHVNNPQSAAQATQDVSKIVSEIEAIQVGLKLPSTQAPAA